ncbi:uncharacterized protein [Diadema antillarum]|uniref:uncharacterized protein n=1 Tax=Diadema antillarum TaxID=105358 RepID=UPI003A886B9D
MDREGALPLLVPPHYMLAESEKRIQAFETKCLRRLLGIHGWEHRTNKFVRNKVTSRVGPQVTLLQMVKRRKLVWFGHVIRHDCLAKTVMQSAAEGGRYRGRQRKSWSDNVKEDSSTHVRPPHNSPR